MVGGDTRNHSVGKTPFESSKPTIEKHNETKVVTSQDSSAITTVPVATRHITLKLSPTLQNFTQSRGHDSKANLAVTGSNTETEEQNAKIQTVNKSYTLCTKQLNAKSQNMTTTSSLPHIGLAKNKARIASQSSSEGQIQLSDLEPLSNLMVS